MFNGCVGIKPTVGRLSTAGVVPACASLDCVSVFAQTVDDAATVVRLARVRSLAALAVSLPARSQEVAEMGTVGSKLQCLVSFNIFAACTEGANCKASHPRAK